MKLIDLNAECGVHLEPLLEFIRTQSADTDIFCFQEVFHKGIVKRWFLGEARPELFSEIEKVLPDFNSYFCAPSEKDVGGLAIFIKKSFTVNKVENMVLFREMNETTDEDDKSYFAMGRNLQSVNFTKDGKTYTIFNFHGMWTAKGKIDTPKRLEQSEKIKKIFDVTKGARILCGDLNLEPDTQSLNILTGENRNLIQEYKITSTRSSSYAKPSKLADYALISPEVEVIDFKVLKDEVSNHLPLFLEFK
ncbi:endonuclease/exonuclease/phosphatase family protein [Candidatus Nomurabacteria bacterium]|nr:endonuclease/exonuclease/phosphatase family protein [Candidatus Nomurabacteria bacterium]